jgi:hypothetical protein
MPGSRDQARELADAHLEAAAREARVRLPALLADDFRSA